MPGCYQSALQLVNKRRRRFTHATGFKNPGAPGGTYEAADTFAAFFH
jgi:hypothetical protein